MPKRHPPRPLAVPRAGDPFRAGTWKWFLPPPMKLHEQQRSYPRSKTRKLLRRRHHKAERRAAKADPNVRPCYNRYAGYLD